MYLLIEGKTYYKVVWNHGSPPQNNRYYHILNVIELLCISINETILAHEACILTIFRWHVIEPSGSVCRNEPRDPARCSSHSCGMAHITNVRLWNRFYVTATCRYQLLSRCAIWRDSSRRCSDIQNINCLTYIDDVILTLYSDLYLYESVLK